uniref:Xep-1 protein n=1 Tax=Xenopus laevis TaxID=8355 RepID=Q91825_XENLA|nr:putative [Xenopus laevis]
MRVLPFQALTVACVFSTGSGDNGDCFFYDQVYKDGDTIKYDCQICECTNGRITDCARDANCIFKKVATPEQNTDAIVYDDDDPNIIESSESKGNVRAKRAASGDIRRTPVLMRQTINSSQTKATVMIMMTQQGTQG